MCIALNPLVDFGISIRLLVLSNHTQIPRLSLLDLRTQQRQPLSNMHQFTDNARLYPRRHRPQIRQLEVAADTTHRKPARLRDPKQDRSRQDIDERRRAAAVQVPHIVAQVRGNGQEKRDRGRRTAGSRFKAEIAGARVDIPVLDSSGFRV